MVFPVADVATHPSNGLASTATQSKIPLERNKQTRTIKRDVSRKRARTSAGLPEIVQAANFRPVNQLSENAVCVTEGPKLLRAGRASEFSTQSPIESGSNRDAPNRGISDAQEKLTQPR